MERMFEPCTTTVGLEFILERPRMIEQFFRLDIVHGVRNVPEPQLGFRQSLMQRLTRSARNQALFVGAAEKDGYPPVFVPLIPISFTSPTTPLAQVYFTR